MYEGKLALVTRSARSIGACIVRNLARKGCNVIIKYATTSSDKAAEDPVQELTETQHVRALPTRSDIFQKGECERLVFTAKEFFAGEGESRFQMISPSTTPPSSK